VKDSTLEFLKLFGHYDPNFQFITIKLPSEMFPPSTNHIYKPTPFRLPNGKPSTRITLSAAGRKYKQDVSKHLNNSGEMVDIKRFVDTHTFVDMYLFLYRPDWITKDGRPSPKPGDCDNRVKILKDVVFEGVDVNDCAAFAVSVKKVYADSPYVTMVFTNQLQVEDFF
jgi:Holliday junction resolvase RusA-like endonuclease